jgi:hypothetical protein
MNSRFSMKTWMKLFKIELSQQKEKEKEKEEQPPLKCVKTSDLQHSFSAMRPSLMSCDTDHDGEQSVMVKRV